MGFHTFVICAYGQSPYLEACIRSLKRQSVPSEIICTTSTPSDWLCEIMEKYGIPLYIRDGHSGIEDDWNYAMDMAEGQFVTIAHQDDLYGRRYVEELQKAYRRWPDMTLFTTGSVTIKNGKRQPPGSVELVKKILRLPLRIKGLGHISAVKKSALIFGNPIICPSCSYLKSQMPNPMFHSGCQFVLDWQCMYELAELPGRFICVEKPLLYYRVHDGSATKACIRNHRRETEEQMMFEKLWPKKIADIIMHGYRRAYKNYE